MTNEAEAAMGERDGVLEIFVAALQGRFGERATAVAKFQLDHATGDALDRWTEIHSRIC